MTYIFVKKTKEPDSLKYEDFLFTFLVESDFFNHVTIWVFFLLFTYIAVLLYLLIINKTIFFIAIVWRVHNNNILSLIDNKHWPDKLKMKRKIAFKCSSQYLFFSLCKQSFKAILCKSKYSAAVNTVYIACYLTQSF